MGLSFGGRLGGIVVPTILTCWLAAGCLDSSGVGPNARPGDVARQSLSLESFKRAEAYLTSLQPGDRFDPKIRVFKSGLLDRALGDSFRDLPFADGWVAGLSGVCGSIINRKDGRVYASHVFGYLSGSILVPKYQVTIIGEAIPKDEYDRLSPEIRHAEGCILRGPEGPLYLKNYRVHSIKRLTFTEPASPVFVTSVDEFKSQFMKAMSRDAFERVRPRIERLALGSADFDVMGQLGGYYMMYSAYAPNLVIDGFLHYKDKYHWGRWVGGDKYSVWPFGYVENEIEVPIMAIIFRNNQVREIALLSADVIRDEFEKIHFK
jgi:hypothetical protein